MPCWNDEIYIDLQNQASLGVKILDSMILYGTFGKSLATPPKKVSRTELWQGGKNHLHHPENTISSWRPLKVSWIVNVD
jgi:hypothetical protein